jgi:hypothetical protein
LQKRAMRPFDLSFLSSSTPYCTVFQCIRANLASGILNLLYMRK